MHSNDYIIDTRKVVIAALKFFVIHRDPYILLDYDKNKKDKKNLTHFIDTTSQFVCSSHFEFQLLAVNWCGVWNQHLLQAWKPNKIFGRSDRSPRIFAIFLEIPQRFFGF